MSDTTKTKPVIEEWVKNDVSTEKCGHLATDSAGRCVNCFVQIYERAKQ